MGGALEWVAPFFRDVSPHVFLRREDGLLILPPSRTYKLNDSAFDVLEHLSNGGRAEDIAAGDPVRERDLAEFFRAFRSLYEDEGIPPGVERIPFDFSFTRLPVLGELAVTYRCNNVCRFCYASCGPSVKPSEELPTRKLKRIIRMFRDEAKIPFFSFTGGEPLLRPDLEKLIRYALSIGLKVNLISNGTLATPRRAASLYRAGLRTAQISLESPDPAIHDLLTGIDGSFSRTVSGIRSLRDAGISVQTNTTVTGLNADSLPRLPAFLSSLGVRKFSMNLFIPTGRGVHNDELFVRYGAIGPIVDRIRKIAFGEGLTFYWYSPTPHCLYNPIARGMGNKSCAAMDGLLSVTPAGDVIPCSSYDEPIGNLFYDGFSAVWNSNRASWFKQKHYAPAECGGCSNFVACQAACPLYWNYAGTGEICRRVGKGA